MTKEEQLRLYSAYFPYKLQFIHIDIDREDDKDVITTLTGVFEDCLTFNNAADYYYNDEEIIVKPILYDLSYLTKEELISAGFTDHIDWLTNEIEGWIEKYGFEKCMNKIPHGHFQYLVSKHFNAFGIPEGEYINKATLCSISD
ncbi:hypothetical protein [Chryseobacterium indologenes]|uniref:Uncharacterized protein n=1 Tax=Chryseobacterium indologenes TaxID=253 RepID=A0A0N0ZTF2_CHRID|nr:hypothetical protein [Chryseobacterium indologenes]KPE50130.1 hypothetical protein AOB46_16970 [Chryseobacterium indologenes]